MAIATSLCTAISLSCSMELVYPIRMRFQLLMSVMLRAENAF